MLVIGSAAEYGAGPGPGKIREQSPAQPLSPYGAAKLCQTLATLSYRHAGLRVLVARLFNVLGPGTPEKLSLGSFARQIARAERGLQEPVIRVGTLSARRDYLGVQDAARALVTLMEAPAASGLYNVCAGRSWSTRELLDGLISLSTRPLSVMEDAQRVKKIDLPDVVGDGSRLRALGWRPEIPIEQSLRETMDWHRKTL